MSSEQKQANRLVRLACVVLVLSLAAGIFPIRLSLARRRAPLPQAILVLGGGPARERSAAELARKHPALHVWVSSGMSVAESRRLFESSGIDVGRLHLDRRAIDTVTNFSTMAPELGRRDVRHVYLVTSEYHMRRAKMIATLILGSRGVAFTPVSVPSEREGESLAHALWDSARALLWVVTGYAGATPRSV